MISSAQRVPVTSTALRMHLRGRSDITPDDETNHLTHLGVSSSTQEHVPETLIASSLALHNQDLVDVMFELEPFQADNLASLAFNMALGGLVHPLHENELKHLRKKKVGIYGPRQWDTPFLSEKLPFTFSSLLSPVAIQKVIRNDIGGENYFRFTSSYGSSLDDTAAIIELLDNITNPRFTSPGAVVQMTSPSINCTKNWNPSWENDCMLSQSNVQVTVAPRGQAFELEYHEHYFSTTLFTGSKVFLAFPPHITNLDHMRRTFQGKRTRLPTLGILREMQQGIAIIQKRGQVLLIPPFWSIMTFCTETSVSAGFFVATASAFMSRIHNMDLWLSECLFWPTLAQRQAQLVPYVEELAGHFSDIMSDDVKQSKPAKSVQRAICLEWVKFSTDKDGEKYESMQEKVGELLGCILDDGTRMRLASVFVEVWVRFCEMKREKNSTCRICGVRVDKLPQDNGEAPDTKLKMHVKSVHCHFDLS
ncbi:hypothetical protein PtrSN002B_005635 [Pyrenophora tritici-repentis]|uniref:Uncharacterized protein n=2 Tax=Pyrenophora tritici-repentis TaxID=45151 RepID=A0A2W1EZ23_9PLEO|nr:hypothetical protein PtrV1_08408 [Pyrenophora tritici-repentis]KAF7449370.1 hypothetical protein A1F99_064190 [Pyrenophora tritici-repentis]KAG9383616.1 hypothetical protein A1F94_005527 [Pyrenophora tritici-repentis]KAI0576638.1 hypothetical protein Alg215_07377 [Pyrenophora tritici-repentis]KAI0585854.1 hypothetical protein Alg130_04543 [Pyrenophora tritici-repentis]